MTDLDTIITDAVAKLTVALKAGDGKAVRAVLAGLLRRQLEDAEVSTHRRRLAEISGDTVALARYYGEIAVGDRELQAELGRKLTAEETAAHKAGARSRVVEARAVAVAQSLRGEKVSMPEWVLR